MIELRSITDLQNLISNQVEENLYLDYKAADALMKTDGKKKEISKDVSAFANSDGGIIIYGIKEFSDPAKRHLPEHIDPVDRISISKEWLEQVINSNISPRLDGLKILPISINTISNEVVYVVEIPKSNTAHQAADLRYYKRNNFESVPMYDFEVRDIMNRNKSPKIELSFEIEQHTFEVKSMFATIPTFPLHQHRQPEKEFETTNTLFVFGHNVGGIFANYVNCDLEIPASILHTKEYDHIDKYVKDGIEYKKIFCDNTIREIKEVTSLMQNTYYKYWPSRYDPILPGTNARLEKIILKRNIELTDGTIFYSIYADNAEKITGQINLCDIEKYERQETENSDDSDE